MSESFSPPAATSPGMRPPVHPVRLAILVVSVVLLGPLERTGLSGPSAVAAQTATVETEENFRLAPNGTLLARIRPGTVLDVEEAGEDWVRATLEGWIWTPSVEADAGSAFDLRVSVEGGENLRVEPQGTILARLEEGTLLQEVERGDGWTRVRRTAWIWRPSLELEPVAGAPTPPSPAPDAGGGSDDWLSGGGDGIAVLSTPDGDTLAVTSPGVEVRVTGRRGSWVRVQVDGWAWMPTAGSQAGEASPIADADPEEVMAEPDAYRGRVVEWDLQYISTEEAEPVRTDFYEGEPYLLTRWAGEGSRFVYVAVPPERLEEIGNLTPLERIRVVGRIRTGNAALTGGPILDLLELARGGGSGGAGPGRR